MNEELKSRTVKLLGLLAAEQCQFLVGNLMTCRDKSVNPRALWCRACEAAQTLEEIEAFKPSFAFSPQRPSLRDLAAERGFSKEAMFSQAYGVVAESGPALTRLEFKMSTSEVISRELGRAEAATAIKAIQQYLRSGSGSGLYEWSEDGRTIAVHLDQVTVFRFWDVAS